MGTILTSQDGITWTQRAVSTAKEISNIVWTGTNYVAIGGSNGTVCFTSTDGITWVQKNGFSNIYGGMLFGLTWNDGLLVTTGWGGRITPTTR